MLSNQGPCLHSPILRSYNPDNNEKDLSINADDIDGHWLLCGVPIDTDVGHHWATFQNRLHLAQRDIPGCSVHDDNDVGDHYVHNDDHDVHDNHDGLLSKLQLDQILFPVHDLHHAILVNLTDVPGFEPSERKWTQIDK